MTTLDTPATVVNPMQRSQWRRLFSPFHIALQLFVAVILYCSGEIDRLLFSWLAVVLIIVIPALVVGVVWIVGVIKSLILRQWLRFASIIIAPLLVWPVLVLLLRTGFDSDWVRFQFNKSSYEQTVQALEGRRPLFLSWNWDSDGLVTGPSSSTLIYDESDQVTLTQGKKANAISFT